MHSLITFMIGGTFGLLMGGIFSACSYDKGFKDGQEAQDEEAIRRN